MHTEYHKIETLYERDPQTFVVNPNVLKNRTFELLKRWVFTEKVDGTNIRAIWNPTDGERLKFGGRTANAQIPADLVNWLRTNVLESRLQEVFPDTSAVLYGEGYGAGIQKVGKEYSAEKKLILFDVLVLDSSPAIAAASEVLHRQVTGQWWLSQENVEDVGRKLGLRVVPVVGEMSLERATEFVRTGFKSLVAETPLAAEGLVGRPAETLYDKKGSRLILKLKTRDFGK